MLESYELWQISLLLMPLMKMKKKKLSWFMSQYAAFKDVSEHGVGNCNDPPFANIYNSELCIKSISVAQWQRGMCVNASFLRSCGYGSVLRRLLKPSHASSHDWANNSNNTIGSDICVFLSCKPSWLGEKMAIVVWYNMDYLCDYVLDIQICWALLSWGIYTCTKSTNMSISLYMVCCYHVFI